MSDACTDDARPSRWTGVVASLRSVLSEIGLVEERKWGKPCFTDDGRNIVIVQEMRDFVALMFFKGALLSDPAGVLVEQGPNSRSARRLMFRSVADVHASADIVRDYAVEAIAVERSSRRLDPAPEPEPAPELRERLDGDPALRAAFDALTPGRRREYHLHIASAKQSATRSSRVDRCVPLIRAGRGLRDR